MTPWQHNENGPLAWTNARWLQSYGGPGPHGIIRISGLRLDIGVIGEPGARFVVIPGDRSGVFPQITTEANGTGVAVHDYSGPGSYRVQIASIGEDESQTVIADQTIEATASEEE